MEDFDLKALYDVDNSVVRYWNYGRIYISLTTIYTFLNILLTIRWYFMDKDIVVC